MEPLSEIYKKLGIAFSFPIEIYDANGKVTYLENSDDYWERYERDAKGYETYYENSEGVKQGTPKSAKTCTPIFENVKNTEGLYDYLIICDERNNTPDIIDSNELRVDIYLRR